MTEQQAEQLGKQVAEILNLKKGKDGRYNTTWGTKTDIGLGMVIQRLVNEALQGE